MDGFSKLTGKLHIPPDLKSKPMAYKYVFENSKEKPVFEFIKPVIHKGSKAVNRVLEIPKQFRDFQEGKQNDLLIHV